LYWRRFHVDDDVGLGTIEMPLAMAPPGAADAEGADVEAAAEDMSMDMAVDADADADTVLKLRPETTAPAWLRATVVVLTDELACSEPEVVMLSPMLGIEYEPDFEEPLLPLERTSPDRMSISMSMKTTSGPATIALLCRSTAWPFRGWSSDVIQIATAPLIPSGTVHSLSGREREKGMPLVSIWQWKPCEFCNTPV
jgi:hypothetical protein